MKSQIQAQEDGDEPDDDRESVVVLILITVICLESLICVSYSYEINIVV